MQQGRIGHQARPVVDSVLRAVAELETERHRALLPEIWARANALIEHRRDRLFAAQAQVPPTLWFVVIVGTLITIATTYVLPRRRLNVAAIAALSCSMGLMFFFIIAMDRPFAGKEGIDPAPFELALQPM